jgi:hypothetical protein
MGTLSELYAFYIYDSISSKALPRIKTFQTNVVEKTKNTFRVQ